MLQFEQHRFRVLDSWRGICAVLVALFHFRDTVSTHLLGTNFIENAYLFVDFFFVLSGFVIFANYEQKLREGFSPWKFMVLRFGRIYPLHFFVLAGLIIVEALPLVLPLHVATPPFQGADNRITFIPEQLLLLHGLGFSDQLSWNFQSWTISAEFFAYAAFAALVVLFRKHIYAVLPLIILAAGAFLIAQGKYLLVNYEFGLIHCLYSFALGGLVWRFYQFSENRMRITASFKKHLFSILEIALMLAMFAVVSYLNNPQTMAVPFLFGFMIWIFAFETGIISRILLQRPFLLLGALSYSIYMLHGPVLGKFDILLAALKQHLLGSDVVYRGEGASLILGDLVMLLYLAIVILLATITYALIEIPGRNFFRRIVKKYP